MPFDPSQRLFLVTSNDEGTKLRFDPTMEAVFQRKGKIIFPFIMMAEGSDNFLAELKAASNPFLSISILINMANNLKWGGDNTVKVDVDEQAKMYGFSERTILRAITFLRSKDLIRKLKGKERKYKLNPRIFFRANTTKWKEALAEWDGMVKVNSSEIKESD